MAGSNVACRSSISLMAASYWAWICSILAARSGTFGSRALVTSSSASSPLPASRSLNLPPLALVRAPGRALAASSAARSLASASVSLSAVLAFCSAAVYSPMSFVLSTILVLASLRYLYHSLRIGQAVSAAAPAVFIAVAKGESWNQCDQL